LMSKLKCARKIRKRQRAWGPLDDVGPEPLTALWGYAWGQLFQAIALAHPSPSRALTLIKAGARTV